MKPSEKEYWNEKVKRYYLKGYIEGRKCSLRHNINLLIRSTTQGGRQMNQQKPSEFRRYDKKRRKV